MLGRNRYKSHKIPCDTSKDLFISKPTHVLSQKIPFQTRSSALPCTPYDETFPALMVSPVQSDVNVVMGNLQSAKRQIVIYGTLYIHYTVLKL